MTCLTLSEVKTHRALCAFANSLTVVLMDTFTGLPNKVRPRLRDSACWRSGEITQPRTSLIREPGTLLDYVVCGLKQFGLEATLQLFPFQATAKCRGGGA